MRQPRRAGQVADRPDPRLTGGTEAVGFDVATLDLHLGAFEPQLFDVADDADGRDQPVCGQAFGLAVGQLDGGGQAVLRLLDPGDFGRSHDPDPGLLEGLVCQRADFFVLGRKNAVDDFDDRDLNA